MVVNLDIEKYEDLQKIKSSYRDYIVLDVKEFQYHDDKVKFKNAIEVLDVVNTINWANQFYKDANSEVRIPKDIFYKCIDASFSNISFTTEKLTEYYKASVLIEDFFMAILKFRHLENYTPYELEFVLFGLSYDEQERLSEKQKEQLHENYGELYCDVRMKKLDVKTFINKITVLINDLKKTLLEDVKKSA